MLFLITFQICIQNSRSRLQNILKAHNGSSERSEKRWEQSAAPKQIELWHSCWLIMFISPIWKLALRINEFEPIYNT